jgi:hypothetical protein
MLLREYVRDVNGVPIHERAARGALVIDGEGILTARAGT